MQNYPLNTNKEYTAKNMFKIIKEEYIIMTLIMTKVIEY